MNKILRKLFFEKVISNEKGSMLILSLLITSVFVTFSAGYLSLVVVEASNTERTHRSNLAMHIAESGTEEAIWEIKYNNSAFDSDDGWTGTGTVADPRLKTAPLITSTGENLGSYTVSVTDPTGSSPGSSPIIETIGQALFQGATLTESRNIKVTLFVHPSNSYQYAAFADTNITMSSSACTDAYNSTLGAYDGPNGPNPTSAPYDNYSTGGDIGTNSTSSSSISMDNDATVYGNAAVGVEGDPNTIITTGNNSDITGTETALTSAVTIPSVTGPTGLTNRDDVSLDEAETLTISSSGQYGNITLDSDSVLTITGNTTLYLTNTLALDGNAQLIIASGANVKIYVDNAITFVSDSLVNNISKDPTKLSIYGTDSMVDDGSLGNEKIYFDSNAIVHATFQTKNATVRLDNNTEVFGAVLANDIRMDTNACIHYDTSLSSGGSSGSNTIVLLWQEK